MRANEPERRIENWDEDLLASLQSALRPESLPPALLERVREDLARRSTAGRAFGLPPMRLAWVAVAAAAVLVVMLSPRPAPQPSSLDASVSLSPEEAAVIVAAYGVLSWNSPIEYTLDEVDASLENIDSTLRRNASGDTYLPWNREDDWDVPAPSDEGSSQSQRPHRALCRDGYDRGQHG